MGKEMQEIEKILWAAADKMIGGLSVTNYKFVVLGIVFLKYISDSFEEKYNKLVSEGLGLEEERDAYLEDNIFYVPEKARWQYLVDHSKDYNIGEILDNALDFIEKENVSLKGVLFKVYNSPEMRNVNLGEIIDLFTNLKIGSKEASEKDVLGRIYEYFLGQFAAKDGQKGGEFYTPACIVKTMVEIIEPYEGRVYDPCCGSGGMFIQSLKFIQQHQGNTRNIAIFGQEKNPTTWKLAKMNLAIRSIDGNLGKFAADTFHEDLHKDLKADFILANPPFNISDWGQEKLTDDYRWKYGTPPKGNANFAWIQHMVSKLSINGKAAIILANGSVAGNGQEGEIRKNLIDADLVDCIIAMPSNLFYTVTIPCSIWILNRNKKQKGKTLFINAQSMGTMVTRKLRELNETDISKIGDTYHNYQNDNNYVDVLGFCKKSDIDDIKQNDYTLIPGRYVGAEEIEDDGISFDEKMKKITLTLSKQFKESKDLEEEIKKSLEAIGYGID
ncbi:MAG: class I SAM-dependent DNA methyltransferase [Bacilli bacterium]|nr:class I SAM-dependent DNA methyltransferase [Bacilli bacterium]